jgi:hypothetical protein
MVDETDMSEIGGEMSLADAPDAEPDFAAIDEMLAAGEPKLAEAFLETVERLVEALQQVSEARGDPQRVAHDALVAAGLEPRGRLIDGEAALHEARHVIAAKKMGLVVERACAADGDARINYSCHVHDFEKAIITALAGTIGDPDRQACADDEHNARARALQLARMRNGLALDAAPSEAVLAEAARVVVRARHRAADLVAANMDAIQRVANALAKGAPLDGAAIDRLIEAK